MSEYKWQYRKVGGMTRIIINSGKDIANLRKLDHKLWTVLGCPASGLEFSGDTLKILDIDNDGMIHVDEVVSTAEYLTSSLKDPDLLLNGADTISVSSFSDTENGSALKEACNKAFDLTGAGSPENISLQLVNDAIAKLQELEINAAEKIEAVLPFGDDSEQIEGLVAGIGKKIDDWFLRCRLAAYNTDSFDKLNVSSDKIAEVGENVLTECMDKISAYPIVRINPDCMLPLSEPVNPAWNADFQKLREILQSEYPDKDSVSETQWDEFKTKVSSYSEYKNKLKETEENLCKEKSDASASITKLRDFLLLLRDFYKFLNNFVTFNDFYSRDPEKLSTFQAGSLYIDQRCCDLCVKVSDISKHADMAGLSGMFLLYCSCTSKILGKTMTIAAAMTRGDVNNLRVGKNAIFYDRDGNDWDATVIKVVDNPISVKQAFWSPYRKFWNWCTEKINKSAEEKDNKALEDLTAKADSATLGAAEADQKESKAKQAFDIAKFAGIFAAIGMAIGYISQALVSLVDGVTAKWYNLPLLIAATILVISGPSMFLAWNKLRKRNLSPILNANGWAVNASSLVKVDFGRTLTSEAKYPSICTSRKAFRCIFFTILILALIAVILQLTGVYDFRSCCFCCR